MPTKSMGNEAFMIIDGKRYPMHITEFKFSPYEYTEVTATLDKCTTEYGLPSVEKVIHNKPATIVYWSDGDKTVVKATKGDKYDKEKGLLISIAKKLMGSKAFFEVMKNVWD